MPITPNTLQRQALQSLQEYREEGKSKALVALPSGAGKTRMAAWDCLDVNAKTILYLVHRNEINDQAVIEFKDVLGISEDKIGYIDRQYKDFDKPILFATVQTLSKDANLAKLVKKIDYVILDEFHHVAAPSYKKIIGQIQPKFFLGLTATPFRLDGKDIFKFVDGNVAFETDIDRGIEAGVLVPFVYIGKEDNVDYSHIEWLSHRYRKRDLDKVLLIDKRDLAIITEFKNTIGIGTKKTIAFCNSVKHVHRMTRKFNKAGISSIGLTYRHRHDARRNLVNRFRNRTASECQVLFVKDIFNEGVDFPEVQALLFLRPTFSKTVFVQQLGRGLRTAPNKENVTVLDFIGNYERAFKIREWLKQIAPKAEIRHHIPVKPEYHHDVPSVYFDSKVIDLFEYQRQLHHVPTKEELIQNYEDAKKKIGRVPKQKELDDRNISKYNMYWYYKYYGSYNAFVESMGDIPNSYRYLTEKINQRLISMAQNALLKHNTKVLTRKIWYSEYRYKLTAKITKLYGNFRNFARVNNMFPKKNCINCNKEFQPNKPNQRLCSSKICISRYNNRIYLQRLRDHTQRSLKQQLKLCTYCSKVFVPTMRSSQKFCSESCSYKYFYTKRQSSIHDNKSKTVMD
jgi:superfamily II DNA or RNA helicase